jgi:leucyl-tRNA synthetase
VMLAPMAPHFASELWARFRYAAHRACPESEFIDWNAGVLSQKWPKVDANHKVSLTFKANNVIITETKVTCEELRRMSEEQALFLALQQPVLVNHIKGKQVLGTNWLVYDDFEGVFTVKIDRSEEKAREKAEKAEKKSKKKLKKDVN